MIGPGYKTLEDSKEDGRNARYCLYKRVMCELLAPDNPTNRHNVVKF